MPDVSTLSSKQRSKKYTVSLAAWFIGLKVVLPLLAPIFVITQPGIAEKLLDWVDSYRKFHLVFYSLAFLCIGALISFVCYRIAKRESQPKLVWAILGFIFHLWAYFALLLICIWKLNKQPDQVPNA